MNAESTAELRHPFRYGPIMPTATLARPRLPRRDAALVEHEPGSAGRRDVERFIRDEYRAHFGARVSHFMPQLIALHSGDGTLRAAVGCRGAASEPLFLETYTGAPIEHVIADRLGITVPRNEIVEVGSLACRDGRAAMDIVTALVPALIGAGFSWVAFTGADTVRNVFRRMKLVPHALCVADQTLLGEARHDWGTYYEHHPIVMAGRIMDGIAPVLSLAGAP